MLPACDPPQDLFFLADAVRRKEHAHGLSNRFRCQIAEESFGARIPRGDGALQGFADNGVTRGFDHGRQTFPYFLGALALGDIGANGYVLAWLSICSSKWHNRGVDPIDRTIFGSVADLVVPHLSL